MYCRQCDKCGAYLDPSEHCDCEKDKALEKEYEMKKSQKMYAFEKGNNQMSFHLREAGGSNYG